MLQKTALRQAARMLLLPALFLGACSTPAVMTTEAEIPIPSHYTTYSGEDGLFSISYPPEWDMKQDELAASEAAVRAILSARTEGVPLAGPGFVFTGGLTPGYLPAVIVFAEPVPADVVTQADLAPVKLKSFMSASSGFREIARTETTLGGLEATLVEYQATMSGLARQDVVAFFMQDGLIWTAHCVSLRQDFADCRDDLYRVARSLRVPAA